MVERKTKWTEQQKRAIRARGSNVLVTASAGTGKTTVLSGRCVNIVSDKSICPDVLSILVLTFTEAAAEQMRSRIAEQLRDAFLEKKDSHLRHQLILLQGADISTIHSFCKRLITEYFYKLGLDPTFGVIDGDEAKLLKAEVLEKTIDWAWQQSNIRAALQQLLYRRDLRTNDGFLTRIIELSVFLDGVVSRQSWYERAARLAEAVDPFATTLGEKQKQIVAERLQHILAQIQYALRLYERENAGGTWSARWKETFIEPVTKYIELIKSGSWEKFSEEIRCYQKPSRFEYKPRGLSGPIAEVIKSAAERAKKSFDRLLDLASLNPDYLNKVSGGASLQTKVLIELVKKFDRLYSQAKLTVNCLDFADLEHYALKLLIQEDSPEDKLLPSETALALRRRYKYIFVDEYQDINPVQQAILDALSSGDNGFVVGDVKQSIYAWRGAEPQIFLERLNPASVDLAHASKGLRVDLNANFRSAKRILDFVNRIFSRIMTASFTKIDYDQSAQLRPAFVDECKDKTVSDEKSIIEFYILDEEKPDTGQQMPDEPENSKSKSDYALDANNTQYDIRNTQYEANVVSSRQRQAAMIAQRIRQMVGTDTGRPEFQIYDKQQDCLRDVDYRDIVVLMRSLAKKANDYVEVLRLAGVPVSCEATAGYFEATEISDVLCLLKVLDNPQRDIELAAVLRSPFFKVTDTELAKIKIHNETDQQQNNYFESLLEYYPHAPDGKLTDKLGKILARIEQWRTIARRGNLADLIWQIYRETNYLSFVSALPNGQARRANLLKLHDRAIQFEGFVSSSGIPSLTRFVEFIEKLLEVGQDWAPAEPQASVGNAVRILSVHKSKGLEFPVVFLAELDSKFNKKDIYGDCLADADDTLGLQIIDRQSNSKLRSLAHEVIAEEKLSTVLAEEMRILYVATTRARDRLILTASQKRQSCRQVISNGFFFRDEAIPDWQLRSCQSPLEWILYALSGQKALHDAFETHLPAGAAEDDLFSFKLYGQAELQQLSRFIIDLKKSKLSRTRPAAKKPRPKRTESPALVFDKKTPGLSVRFDYSRALQRKPSFVARATSHEPRVTGTATHLVISQLDLTQPITVEVITATVENLVADGAIGPAVAECIDTKSILTFFQSELGRLALDAENTVWREWPFTFALPASLVARTTSHESRVTDDEAVARRSSLVARTTSHGSRVTDDEVVIIQGIIDMLIQTQQGLVVIDFKTDDVTPTEVAGRAELYRRQLDLYSRAASAVLKSKLIAKWLYFLTPGRAIEV